MTNANKIFELTMSLMDELSDRGAFDTSDTAEYKNRTLAILNVLRGEFTPLNDTGLMPKAITNFECNIDLDDYTCQSILPYGLAAHLLLDENPSAAGFFQQRYEELKRKTIAARPSVSEEIVDVYGDHFPYNEFGMWS